jgi:hypothetical protein
MSLQGPIVLVAEKPAGGLVQAFTSAGAFPIIETRWSDAPAAVGSIKPSAVVLAEPDPADPGAALALAREIDSANPLVPVIARVRDGAAPALPDALPISADAPVERLIARLSSALRLRALHATVLGRARSLKSERNIVADMPEGDPLDDATVLVVGRGRQHPTLSVAVGERVGVMGALSVDFAARCLNAREIDGIVIGDGLPARQVDAFLTVLAEDPRFRDLPIAVLNAGGDADGLPNFLRGGNPHELIERILPLVRLRAFESGLKRLLQSIECKGMLDARTGLLHLDAFGRDLSRAIDDAGERGVGLSVARFAFEEEIDRRTSMDAARLMSRLMRNVDFGCRQDDGSIVTVFTETDLRHAHVVARRLASVLKHTMLRPDRERPALAPSVTLATLKPKDTLLTLMARVAPRPVAAGEMRA